MSRLARYRAMLIEGPKNSKSEVWLLIYHLSFLFIYLRLRLQGEGFEVNKSGDARVVMIGFPSVGKV